MRNTTLCLLTFVLLASFSFSVRAEDTPFGSLVPEEEVVEVVGSIDQYREYIDDYDEIAEELNEAYGERKQQLEEDLVSKAKQILFSKLGAVEKYLNRMAESEDVGDTDQDFLDKKIDYADKINSAEDMGKLREVETELNEEIFRVLLSLREIIAKWSHDRAILVITKTLKESRVIQAHINAAAERGANGEKLQQVFDNAMLEIERAQADYSKLLNVLEDEEEEAAERRTDSINRRLDNANGNLEDGVNGLVGVLQMLQEEYSQTPWQLTPEVVESFESTESTESNTDGSN